MIRKKPVRPVICYAVLVLTIIAAFVFQSILLPAVGVKAPVFLLLPLTVAIAMFEKEFTGMFFGLFAGALFDLSSSAPDGVFALFFTAIAYLTGILSRRYLRNTGFVAMLVSIAASLVLCITALTVNYLSADKTAVFAIIQNIYIPAFTATVISSPFMIILTRAIEKIKP